MRFQDQLRLRLRSLFANKRQESELDEELRFHLEKEAEQNRARGVADKNAQREALREFGRVVEIKQQCRQARGMRIFDELGRDIRYALRTLRRSPSFTIRRTNEIGLRSALGAQRGDILWLILREDLRLVSLGIALGLLGALATTRVAEACCSSARWMIP